MHTKIMRNLDLVLCLLFSDLLLDLILKCLHFLINSHLKSLVNDVLDATSQVKWQVVKILLVLLGWVHSILLLHFLVQLSEVGTFFRSLWRESILSWVSLTVTRRSNIIVILVWLWILILVRVVVCWTWAFLIWSVTLSSWRAISI